jgi:hypothetical protein
MINISTAKYLYEDYKLTMAWEEFLFALEQGIQLALNNKPATNCSISELQVLRMAIEYDMCVFVGHLSEK